MFKIILLYENCLVLVFTKWFGKTLVKVSSGIEIFILIYNDILTHLSLIPVVNTALVAKLAPGFEPHVLYVKN